MLVNWAESAWTWFSNHLSAYPADAKKWHEEIINDFAIKHDVQEGCTALIR
jgi:hypothetical protein